MRRIVDAIRIPHLGPDERVMIRFHKEAQRYLITGIDRDAYSVTTILTGRGYELYDNRANYDTPMEFARDFGANAEKYKERKLFRFHAPEPDDPVSLHHDRHSVLISAIPALNAEDIRQLKARGFGIFEEK